MPAQWAGRAIRCPRLHGTGGLTARGYLSGLGLASYNETGTISGVRLPPGLGEGSRLPEPVFTPTTKAATGHDEPMTRADVAALVGEPAAAELERATLKVYRRGAELAASRGVIIADTKLSSGGGGWDTDAGRRVHTGLLPLLAGLGVAARTPATLAGQAVRPDWSASVAWDRRHRDQPSRPISSRRPRRGTRSCTRGLRRTADASQPPSSSAPAQDQHASTLHTSIAGPAAGLAGRLGPASGGGVRLTWTSLTTCRRRTASRSKSAVTISKPVFPGA